MIAFDVPGGRFTARVAGVCIRDGHVLLQSFDGADAWFLPGGRCEIGETSHESLCREMREELHVDVRADRILWVAENFFEHEAKLFHEIGLYY
jgi:8-oxo-dGTP pyrophosphatase MutT (NUDIX family)